MPSENTFKKQIELVQAYLGAFENVSKIDAPVVIKSSLEYLSSATSDLHKFIPHFNERPLYIETVVSAYEAMDSYFSKHTAVARPFSYTRVVGLYSMAKNLSSSERQGTY
jgi:hypothetical protein